MTPAQQRSAILAGLRLLERATDDYDGPGSRTVVSLAGIGGILTNEGAHDAPSAQEIDAFCETINGGHLLILATDEYEALRAATEITYDDVDPVPPEFRESGARVYALFHPR